MLTIAYRYRKQRRPAVLAAGLLFCTALSTLAQTTIVVNSTAQEATTANPNGIANGNCTLGEAILSANTGASVDACTFTGSGAPYTIQLPNQSFTLSSVDNYWYGPNALPPIASNIVIAGNGATLQITDSTIVRLRFFYIGANPQAAATLGFNTPGAGQLTLQNLTLIGGRQRGGEAQSFTGSGGAGMGGAIFNQGVLDLIGVTLTGNSATGGSNTLSGFAGGGAGMGQDAGSDTNGSGFGGSVSPAGGSGGPDYYPPSGNGSVGGGGGGFGATDNGQSGGNGGAGGGPSDGLGGAGDGPNFTTGHGSGSGAISATFRLARVAAETSEREAVGAVEAVSAAAAATILGMTPAAAAGLAAVAVGTGAADLVGEPVTRSTTVTVAAAGAAARVWAAPSSITAAPSASPTAP